MESLRCQRFQGLTTRKWQSHTTQTWPCDSLLPNRETCTDARLHQLAEGFTGDCPSKSRGLWPCPRSQREAAFTSCPGRCWRCLGGPVINSQGSLVPSRCCEHLLHSSACRLLEVQPIEMQSIGMSCGPWQGYTGMILGTAKPEGSLTHH